MTRVRCTASGQERNWGEAWSGFVPGGAVMMVQCPDCGLVAPHDDLVWVRGSDLAPRAKTRAHQAPDGVTPGPYAVLENGGRVVESAQERCPHGTVETATTRCRDCNRERAVQK